MDEGDLSKRVSDETSKMFSSGNFQSFCVALLKGKRPLNSQANPTKVKEDAEKLNRLILQGSKEAKPAFVEILTERSWGHLAALAGSFQEISKKYTMKTAIEHAFGSSDTGKGMSILVDFVSQPYDFWAKKVCASLLFFFFSHAFIFF